MAGYRKKKKPHQKEKPLFGKDFVCFFALVKETVKACGPYKFVIIDKAGKEIPVHLTKTGDTWIDGKKLIDADAREFIAKNPGDFERLFLEVTKKYDPDLHIMPRLYLAKLTDMSGTYKKPATVKFYDGEKMREFKIERAGLDGRFYLDEMPITKNEAIEYVETHYGGFLVGMKDAMKAMKRVNTFENNKFLSTYGQKAKAQVKHSEVVDGKLQVDIDSFLPQKKKAVSSEHEMKASKDIITTPKRGYIES